MDLAVQPPHNAGSFAAPQSSCSWCWLRAHCGGSCWEGSGCPWVETGPAWEALWPDLHGLFLEQSQVTPPALSVPGRHRPDHQQLRPNPNEQLHEEMGLLPRLAEGEAGRGNLLGHPELWAWGCQGCGEGLHSLGCSS